MQEHLEQRNHTHLRDIRGLRHLLASMQTSSSGFSNLANAIDDEWRMVAKGLQIHEDYHGFYIDAFEGSAERTVADMLVEVEPRQFTADEAGGARWSPSSDSLIQLLNWAWQVYADQPETYDEWEGDKIRLLLHG